MNKLIKGLLTVSLAASLAFAAACGQTSSDSWKGTTFTNYGEINQATLGGFVAETDNYVYFINGIGSSSSDNSYGTPIKGALVAADKKDLNSAQVVIPELMVSSEYGAGVYIFKEGNNAYAYYGTPNKEKNSSGDIAYSEMTFTRTSLDGKDTEKLFTVPSHSTTYRIAQANGKVYIIYYDTAESALISYDCKEGAKTVIAKTDAESNVKTDGEYRSLGEYKFLNNESGAQVAFIMTVYTEEYIKDKAESQSSYSREQANYNYMYIYTAGKGAVLVANGKADENKEDTKYALKSNAGEYLFYTATPINGSEETYGGKVADLAALSDAVKIKYASNIKDGMIIKALDEVYYYDSDAKTVVQNTLIKDDNADPQINEFNNKKTVLKDDTVSSLIDINDDYIYCFNSEGYIVAKERVQNGKTVRISDRTASSSWYKPETVEIGGTEYMLYCDSSAEGNSYIYSAKLDFSAENVKTEDTDDDGETDLYYIESSFIGVRPAADRAAAATVKINAIESTLELKTESADGTLYSESVLAARAAYNALDDDAKAEVAEDALKKLVNTEKAVVLANLFTKLETVIDYDVLDDDAKAALKANYQAAKAKVEEYGDDYKTIAGYLENNLNYFYQQAKSKIN